MAGDYILQDSAASSGFDKTLKTVIILAVFLLAVILIWLLGIAPFRPFSKIDIIGGDVLEGSLAGIGFRQAQAEDFGLFGLGRDEILAEAGIDMDSSFFSTNARAVEKALSGFVFIESVKVFKHFPDRLQIILNSRKAVACAFAGIDGRTVPVLFDSNGVIFRIGEEIMNGSPFNPAGCPVISGLSIKDPVPGMRFPVIFTPLFKELEKIKTTAPELLTAVSELRINPKSFDSFDLVLYPVNKRVKVSLSEINEDLLRYTLLMVDVLASREPGIETLDFRSGIASYIPKEASSEQ